MVCFVFNQLFVGLLILVATSMAQLDFFLLLWSAFDALLSLFLVVLLPERVLASFQRQTGEGSTDPAD